MNNALSNFLSSKSAATSLTALALLLSGCAAVDSQKIAKDTNDKAADRKAVMAEAFQKDFAGKTANSSFVVIKDEIFVASKSSTSKGDANLPALFDSVVLRFPGRYTLAALAERITKETRIPVTIDADVARASEGSQPINVAIQRSKDAFAQQREVNPFVNTEESIDIYRNTPNTLYSEEFELDYTGPLGELLDLVAAKGRISWEYKKGAITFSKTTTKTFFVNALPGKLSSRRTINTSVGGSGAGGSSPAGDGSIRTEANFSPIESIAESIKSLLSPIGKMTTNETSGTITITDIKSVIDRADRIVRLENELMNRQVRVRVDFLSVKYDGSAQAGIDLNLALANVTNAGDLEAVDVTPGGSLVSGDAGSLSYRIKGIDFDASLLLRALSTIGETTVLSRKAVTTLNRQSSPIVVANQTTYIAETTPANGGLTGGGAVGLVPGTVNTGLSLDILPIVTPDNKLIIQMALDISELVRIDRASSGEGPNQQQIQTPEVNTMSFLERVTMENGETLVMVGYERDLSRSDGRNGLSGISSTGSQKREAFLIALTPTLD